ncbi:MAG: putative bifunctional diguanylate cyclase/phosphodiesterase [Rhizobiaceae bacterium]
MVFSDDSGHAGRSHELPKPIYESVVRSLYGDQKSLLVGWLSIALAPIILFARSGDSIQLVFALLLALLGGARQLDGMAFNRAAKRPLSLRAISKWESRYAVMGALYVGVLGSWCMAGMAVSSDEFVHLMSIAITLSYIVGIIGRNFSSEKVVLSQTIFTGIPMVSGFVLFGGIYHQLLGLFLLPFFFTIWTMSKNLRRVLFGAVVTAEDNRTIATRFDVALGNISHGIAMFDATGKFAVVNARFAPLAGMYSGNGLENQDFSSLDAEVSLVDDEPGKECQLSQIVENLIDAGIRSELKYCLPDGRVIEAKFNPMADEGGVLVLEDITSRVTSEAEIRKLASFDALTHLPNRRYFSHEVNRMLGGGDGLDPCSVFFVDLDNFKDVNDSLGHAVGDKLLCSIALRMRSRMPSNALACRFGGDEFVIMIPGKLRRKDCQKFAEKLIAEISNPVLIDGHQINVGASVGIAQCPANGQDFNQLLKVSDVALYDAKARGRGRYSFYSDELGDVVRDRRALENELRRAIKQDQMEVHFQPLVNVEESRISTCEALLRWKHPERGHISPSVFIPIAEEIGMISQIGKFVMEEAAQRCMEWPEYVSVAVNVSSLQFQQSDVCAVVSGALAKSGLDPKRLEVEVTESAMLKNIDETTAVLSKLSDAGVRISLDDFGTGFSSLSYLHALPLDKVKIDRSFIEDINTDERSLVLLSGVTHLAKELGLQITIEGIETEEQRDILMSMVKVDEMQGYLFGKAMPANDVSELLEYPSIELSTSVRLTG